MPPPDQVTDPCVSPCSLAAAASVRADLQQFAFADASSSGHSSLPLNGTAAEGTTGSVTTSTSKCLSSAPACRGNLDKNLGGDCKDNSADRRDISSLQHVTGAGAVRDKLQWWGEVAKAAYEAIDGCLEGFEDAVPESSLTPSTAAGLSAQETEMIKVWSWQPARLQ